MTTVPGLSASISSSYALSITAQASELSLFPSHQQLHSLPFPAKLVHYHFIYSITFQINSIANTTIQIVQERITQLSTSSIGATINQPLTLMAQYVTGTDVMLSMTLYMGTTNVLPKNQLLNFGASPDLTQTVNVANKKV